MFFNYNNKLHTDSIEINYHTNDNDLIEYKTNDMKYNIKIDIENDIENNIDIENDVEYNIKYDMENDVKYDMQYNIKPTDYLEKYLNINHKPNKLHTTKHDHDYNFFSLTKYINNNQVCYYDTIGYDIQLNTEYDDILVKLESFNEDIDNHSYTYIQMKLKNYLDQLGEYKYADISNNVKDNLTFQIEFTKKYLSKNDLI